MVAKGIIKCIHRKNRLYKEAIKKKPDNFISKYKIYKNKLIKINRNAEKIYIAEHFNEATDTIKNVWFEIKQFICPNISKCSKIKEIDINEKALTDITIMVDWFIDYFVSVGPNLANKISLGSGSHLDYINIYNNNNMFVLPVTPSEICDVIATFKFNKSAG